MSKTHTIVETIAYTSSDLSRFTQTTSQTAGSETVVSESFTDATDALVAFTLDVSQCKSLAMWSVGGNMTVETNSSSSPADTFALVDGVPVVWSSAMLGTPDNPVGTDVTALYVTNTGTARLEIRVLFDPTV